MSSNDPLLPDARAQSDGARWAIVVAGLAVAQLVARGLMFWDFKPLWDGALYVECLNNGARELVRGGNILGGLNCFSHPTMGYLGLLSPAWLVAGEPGLLVANLALAGAAVWAIWRSAAIVAPGRPMTAALAALTYSMQPLLLANAVNFTADHGVTCFLALTLWALLAKRPWLAVVFGLLLSFSKETGGALYALAAGCSGLALLGLGQGPLAGRFKAVLRLWPLALPTLAFFAFMVWKRFYSDTGLWVGASEGSVQDALKNLELTAVVFTYLLSMLVLNFAWLFVIPILLWPAARLLPPASEPLTPVDARTSPREARLFLILLLVSSVWLLTRFQTITNPRYLFCFAAVLTLCGVTALTDLIRQNAVRNGLLIGAAGLLLVSNYRTVDPLSRAQFGTFQFGRHEMLDMTSITRECCGHGRDQLQYNLEFTAISYLTDEALRAVKATPDTRLYLSPLADWHLLGPVDPASHRRQLQLGDYPPKMEWAAPFDGAPGHYFAYPNVPSEKDLASLSRCALVGPPMTLTRNGYAMQIHSVAPRPDAPADCRNAG